MMRTRLIYVIVFAFISQVVNAQTFGLKGGINFANMTISSGGASLTPKSITEFHFGPVADFNLSNSFDLNTGLLYSLKGFQMESGGQSAKEILNYLEIPVNLAFKVPIKDKNKFFVEAGPYFAYALSGKDKVNGESTNITFGSGSNRRFDAGLGIGAGVEFGSIVASLNYQIGLANVIDVDASEAKLKTFQISLAYMFGKK